MKITATNQGCDERNRHDPEDAAGIFADRRIGKADGEEASGCDQRPREHRKRSGFPGKGRRLHAVPALFHFHHHHLDRDDGVVDQEAERNDQRAERDAVQIERHRVHHDEDDAEHQRHRECHHDAGAPAERDKGDEQHDRERLDEGVHELADGVLDHLGLVGDLLDVDALRHRLQELGGRLLDLLAELEDVGALGGDDADAERGLAFLTHLEARRIDIAVRDCCDIAEPEHTAVALDRRFGNRLDAVKRTGDAQRHALRRGLDRAGRRDIVLLGERVEQRLRRDAERRELGMRELDEDALVLGAVKVDLGNARHLQQTLAKTLRDLLELRVIGAVAGHHIEDRIDVGEFVVDHGAEDAGGQLALHVNQLLAQQIEEIGHVLRRGRILEGDLHRGEAWLGIGLHLVEERQLLQFLLDRIGDLHLHFLRGRARPHHRDVHHLDGEERILGAAELLIGEEAGGAEDDHQEQHQRRMADRPGRKVEALHVSLQIPKPLSPRPSLRGALATKQSTLVLLRDGLLRFARNDGTTTN
ncbi:hypothetical protein ACVWY2_008208 [Bradyrhizobium sp. JR6.1]